MRTLYIMQNIDGAYLYTVTEKKPGQWYPDSRCGARLEREPGKGNIITAEYGRDIEKAKTFQSRKLAEDYQKNHPVLRFCTIFKKPQPK